MVHKIRVRPTYFVWHCGIQRQPYARAPNSRQYNQEHWRYRLETQVPSVLSSVVADRHVGDDHQRVLMILDRQRPHRIVEELALLSCDLERHQTTFVCHLMEKSSHSTQDFSPSYGGLWSRSTELKLSRIIHQTIGLTKQLMMPQYILVGEFLPMMRLTIVILGDSLPSSISIK